MKLYLDHDRTPLGIVLLRQATFFSRECSFDERLADRLERIIDGATKLRSCLQRVYEQPDYRVRAAVLETVTEEMKAICDAVENAGKPSRQVSEVTSSAKSRSQQKRLESQRGTNRKTEPSGTPPSPGPTSPTSS